MSEPFELLCNRLLRISTESDMGDAGLAIDELDARTLFDQFPEFIYIKDRRSRYVLANACMVRAHGIVGSAALIGRTDFDFFDNETAKLLFADEQEAMASGTAIKGVEHRIVVRGSPMWLITTKMPLRDRNGAVVGLVGISRDVTERRRQEELRRGHARLFEMIARGQPLQIVLDALVRLVEAELDGIKASVLLLEEGGILRHGSAPGLPDAYVELIEGLSIGPKAGSCGTAAWRRSPVIVADTFSDALWEDYREIARRFGLRSCWSTPIMGAENHVLGTFALYSGEVREPTPLELELTAMATDLAGIAIERVRSEERIRHMAHHDPLTGLPNRTLFWAQFAKVLDNARSSGRTIAVTYIDLDNFKQINDSLGHAVGDEVLKTLSARMADTIGSGNLIARLGGDEFVIVFSDPMHEGAKSLKCLEELRSSISRPVAVGASSVHATCSMGVSLFPRDGETPKALLASADRAMYEAKDLGRDRLRVCQALGRGV
jgi:diguanylate cyclase (GGDEF)-like protein/PAS domain S-box-containing protein